MRRRRAGNSTECGRVAAVHFREANDVRPREIIASARTIDGGSDSFSVLSLDVHLHVIEHVGGPDLQQAHLAELRRVLAASGFGYLAVPSRWQVVEPHYGVAFLSWLPESWRTPYLRLRGRGREYDCRPLSMPELEEKLRRAGFEFEQQHGRALRLTYELERPNAWFYRWLLKPIPDSLYAALRSAFPTLLYVLTIKKQPGLTDNGAAQ